MTATGLRAATTASASDHRADNPARRSARKAIPLVAKMRRIPTYFPESSGNPQTWAWDASTHKALGNAVVHKPSTGGASGGLPSVARWAAHHASKSGWAIG